MKDYKCCVCGKAMEEKMMGLEFVKFTDARTPLYRKLYAYYCPVCKAFRQAEDVGATI